MQPIKKPNGQLAYGVDCAVAAERRTTLRDLKRMNIKPRYEWVERDGVPMQMLVIPGIGENFFKPWKRKTRKRLRVSFLERMGRRAPCRLTPSSDHGTGLGIFACARHPRQPGGSLTVID